MEIFTHPFVAAVLLILLLVFVHETGHFLVGRLCGIAVEIYSIGFGPPIFSWQKGTTNYRVSWLPLGGFVKFYGMMPGETIPDKVDGIPFNRASLPRRFATVAAGPFANFFLAFVVYTGFGMDGIEHHQAIVGEVQNESPALVAGLQFEDQIVAIDGQPIKTWAEMAEHISTNPGQKLQLSVRRDGEIRSIAIVPEAVEAVDIFGKPGEVGRIGIVYQATPSVVALQPQQSPASKAGLATGDTVTSVQINGERHEVKFFRKFIKLVGTAISQGEDKLVIEYLPWKSDQPKQTTLELSGIQGRLAKEHPDRVARDLGFASPQLLIGELSESAEGKLLAKDRVIKWNDTEVQNQVDLAQLIVKNEQMTVPVTVVRGLNVETIDVTHQELIIQRPEGKQTIFKLPVESFLGDSIELPPYVEKYDNIFAAVWFGAKETATQATFLAATLGKLISGDVPLKALGGPILIAKVASDAAKRGVKDYLGTLALISVNLGVLNLFPIPALDGGQLLVFGVEAVRRRRLSEVAIENFQKVGFVMIMALVVLAVYNDLSRFWTSMLKGVVGMFN